MGWVCFSFHFCTLLNVLSVYFFILPTVPISVIMPCEIDEMRQPGQSMGGTVVSPVSMLNL